MTSRLVSVRAFLTASAFGLLICVVAAAAAAWRIDQAIQDSARVSQLAQMGAYVGQNATRAGDKNWTRTFAGRLASGHVDAELTIEEPEGGKHLLYASTDLASPDLLTGGAASGLIGPLAGNPGVAAHERITRPSAVYAFRSGPARSRAVLVLDLWGSPLDGTRSVLVAGAAGLAALLATLTIVVLAATRWIVRPLQRLSADVDAIAGGEFTAAPPASRLREITNVGTAIRGMGAALKKTADHGARAEAERQFMVSAAAHDLRTPLFALRGHLEAIAAGIGPASQHLDKARAKAAQLERLVASLFAHARAELGEPPRLETADLTEAVRSAVRGLEIIADEKRIQLRITGRTVPAVIDRERFERVVTNILDNALRHAPTGGTVQIAVGTEPSAAAFVSISDDGPGIPPDLLPRIFEPMVQGDHHQPRGAGLGLAIAARLMESQNGTITAENRCALGAIFTIRLRSPEPR
jgi:signal transduction histidine kinase